jgi:lipopolysaccharide/colanic/teichoic acid biosynthesis glycosyltransferase
MPYSLNIKQVDLIVKIPLLKVGGRTMGSKVAAGVTTWSEREITEGIFPVWKRVFDILFSMCALIFLFPVILMISILILVTDGRPITFKQKRIGREGKTFFIMKFRSMCNNAEEVLQKDPEIYKKYIDNSYKLPEGEDPRITKLGSWLRKTSLDELLQFWNVLKGDMSIVGPRPVVLIELEEYGINKHLFLSMKPGVTGVWQVAGRSNIGYPERADLELSYLYRQGLVSDIIIVIKTVALVLRHTGAH